MWKLVVSDLASRGCGCSVAALRLHDDERAEIAWVGDVRVYRLRDGDVTLLTRDHTLLDDYIRKGLLRADDPQVAAFPHPNVIVRTLGMKESVEVDVALLATQPGDLFAIVSTGVPSALGEELIARTLRERPMDTESCAQSLIESARANAARDDLHVVLVPIT